MDTDGFSGGWGWGDGVLGSGARVGRREGWTKGYGRGMVVAMIRKLPDSVVVWCGRRSEEWGAGVRCGGVCGVEFQRDWGRLL